MPPIHLIVGGDSLVGGALAATFESAGKTFLTTTRRHEEVDDTCLYLDLACNVDQWQCPPHVDVAFLCASVTRIEACEKDPAGSARVNVDGISALAKRLAACGVFVVYLSTNQVFDGSVPRQRANAPYSPTTEYGRQKAAAERAVLALANSAVVRFTKIFSPEMPLIVQWRACLERGEVIRPFSDLIMAPVPVGFCAEVLRRVGASRSPGIFQVSADRDITYAEAGRYVARRLGASESLVQPIESVDAGVCLGPARSHTTLDSGRLSDEFGLSVPEVWATLDNAFLEPKQMSGAV